MFLIEICLSTRINDGDDDDDDDAKKKNRINELATLSARFTEIKMLMSGKV